MFNNSYFALLLTYILSIALPMKLKYSQPLTKLSQKADFCLFLIGEELKIRKFFNTLRKVGIEDCSYEPDLSFLILKSIGLNDGKDDTYYHYSDLIDRRSKKIKPEQDSIMKQALKVYQELMNEKKKRKGSTSKL